MLIENNLKKKILIFSNVQPFQDIKGTGNWIVSLIDQLRSTENYQVFLAYHDKNVENIEYGKKHFIQIIKIPFSHKKNRLKKFLSKWLILDKYENATNNYLEIINKIAPDIIQIFGLESPFIRIVNKTDLPIIIHIQGLLQSYFYKYYPRFASHEILLAKGIKEIIKGNIPWIEKKEIAKHIKIEREIGEKIKYCLGRTDWDRRCIKSLNPLTKYFYCQEILRSQFYRTVWSPIKNEKSILYTTIKDTYYKNVDIIYETCSILEKNGNINFEWRIGGVNSNDITPKIMKRRNKQIKNITLLGTLSELEIINEMLKAHIFIIPSGIENSPNALEEAMLIGMPVIATNAGGISSIIDNDEIGTLVNEGDPYSLAGAILEQLSNYEKAVEMGKKSRQVSLERHDPQRIIKDLGKIYEKILNTELTEL